jgi:hypothetical protein
MIEEPRYRRRAKDKPGNAGRSGPSRCSAECRWFMPHACGAWEGNLPLHLAMHHDSSDCGLALALSSPRRR